MSQNMFGCRGLGSGCLRLCVSRQLNKFSTPVCGACHCCIHGLSKITMAVVRNKEKMMQTVHLVFSLSHSQDSVDFISQSVGDYCLSSTLICSYSVESFQDRPQQVATRNKIMLLGINLY